MNGGSTRNDVLNCFLYNYYFPKSFDSVYHVSQTLVIQPFELFGFEYKTFKSNIMLVVVRKPIFSKT